MEFDTIESNEQLNQQRWALVGNLVGDRVGNNVGNMSATQVCNMSATGTT